MNPENPYGLPAPGEGPLILSQVSVRGSEKIAVPPSQALLFTDAAGQVVRLSAYPGWWDVRRYQLRYLVDLTRRHSVLETQVPSQRRTASFLVTLEVSWGVTDPAAVVKTGLTDGLTIIRPRLLETAASIGNSYPIGEFVDLQQHLNRLLGSNGPVYGEGVGVFHCTARVRPDDRYQGQLIAIDDAKHEISMTELKGGWVEHIDSPWSMLQQYLKQHPDALPEVWAELQRRADNGDARAQERFNLLMKSEKVKDPADAEEYLRLARENNREYATDLLDQPQVTVQRAQEIPAAPAEQEDIMPADLVPDDGVQEWVDTPWQQDGS